ncbi:MAG TPA: TonB family protein [Terriglobales bacterium]
MATQVSDTGKTRTRGTPADELAIIAQRAQAFTSASGTAIAISEGNSDEIICRARSGSSAPEVGTALRVEGSFTGLCIQSGKELRCDDAETDTRVDTVAIRSLGIRAMVVTPIKEENRVVGVLAVFAPIAHAFTITHVAVLKTMADQISQLLQKERRSRDETPEPESHSMVPVALARSAVSTATPVLPAPVVVKPALRPVAPVIARVEPIRAAPVVEPLAAPVTPTRREERRMEPKSQLQPAAMGFGTFETVGASREKSVSHWVFVTAGGLVIAAGATFAYLKMHKPTVPASHPQAIVAPAPSTSPAAPVPTTPGNSGSETVAVPSPLATNTTAAKPKDESTGSGKRAEKNSKPPSPPAPESKRTEETVALASGPSRIAGSASNDPSQPAPETTPSLTVGGASAESSLNSLASPREASTPSMVAQSSLEPLKVIKRVAPIFPPVARQRMMSSTVVVEALVTREGKVTQVRFVSGSPIFRQAAFDAVKQWEYQPAKLNGQPIEQKTTIQLLFNPK